MADERGRHDVSRLMVRQAVEGRSPLPQGRRRSAAVWRRRSLCGRMVGLDERRMPEVRDESQQLLPRLRDALRDDRHVGLIHHRVELEVVSWRQHHLLGERHELIHLRNDRRGT